MRDLQALFPPPQSFDDQIKIKIYDGTLVKNVWKGEVYKPKMNIKNRLEGFGIDTRKHTFLFPYLAIYNIEASLQAATMEIATKQAKICADVNGVQVECELKLKATHELLSYSTCTNVLLVEQESFCMWPQGFGRGY